MANINYNYTPLYGVEPYADNGGLGGAKITNDNLVITAWTISEKAQEPPLPFVDINSILFPMSQNANVSDNKRVAALPAMHSRCSAEIWIDANTDPDFFEEGVLFVLNPPGELKQQMARSLSFNGGNPLDLANYTINRSLQGMYTWEVNNLISDPAAQNAGTVPGAAEAFYSEYGPIGDYDGSSDVNPIPLLKTNGADGVKPEFFDVFTEAGVNEMIAAVNLGNFYIAMVFFNTITAGSHTFIKWPHSTARG